MSWELGLGKYLVWNVTSEELTVSEAGLGKGAKAFALSTMVLLVLLFWLVEQDFKRRSALHPRQETSLPTVDAGALAMPQVPPQIKLQYYTVVKGDSLPKIARKVYGDAKSWPIILEANREELPSPRHLRVGMRLYIPPKKRLSSH